MKTERRHELQENELANWLGEKINAIRPFGKTLLGLLVLGLVALLVSSYVNNRNLRAKQEGWTAYFDAMGAPNAESFEAVAKSFPDTPAGAWALQTAGDLRLDEALREMFRDREVAQQELLAAREIYERVLGMARDHMLKQRAMFGLAKSLESQGELDQAKARYEEITTIWPKSQIGQMAQRRLDELQKPGAQSWYTWFAKQEPVRSPLTDPDVFQDIPNLPDQPDLQMPEAGQLLPPSGQPAADLDVDPAGDAGGADPEFQLPGDDAAPTDSTSDPVKLDLDTELDDPNTPPDAPLDLNLELESPAPTDAP